MTLLALDWRLWVFSHVHLPPTCMAFVTSPTHHQKGASASPDLLLSTRARRVPLQGEILTEVTEEVPPPPKTAFGANLTSPKSDTARPSHPFSVPFAIQADTSKTPRLAHEQDQGLA